MADLRKEYSRIPIGHQAFDSALGGGLVKGSIVELRGQAGSGKRSLAYAACASAIAKGLGVHWIEVNGATADYDAIYARACVRAMFPVSTCTGELGNRGAIELANRAVGTGRLGLVVVCHAERIGDGEGIEEISIRLVNQQLRRLCSVAMSTGTAVLVLVSVPSYPKVGVDWVSIPEETVIVSNPLRFYAGIRVELKSQRWTGVDGRIVGIEGGGKVLKNKFAMPFETFGFRVQDAKGLAITVPSGATGTAGPDPSEEKARVGSGRAGPVSG